MNKIHAEIDHKMIGILASGSVSSQVWFVISLAQVQLCPHMISWQSLGTQDKLLFPLWLLDSRPIFPKRASINRVWLNSIVMYCFKPQANFSFQTTRTNEVLNCLLEVGFYILNSQIYGIATSCGNHEICTSMSGFYAWKKRRSAGYGVQVKKSCLLMIVFLSRLWRHKVGKMAQPPNSLIMSCRFEIVSIFILIVSKQ